MLDLARFQSEFADAIIGSSMSGALASQPGFAVYRNTPLKAAIDALTANYPTIDTLLGNKAFSAVASIYALQFRPVSPVLNDYGAEFADFLASSPLADDLPYLADVARIDRLWTEVFVAADAPALMLDAAAVSSLADRIVLHPASRHLWLDSPAATIWLAHQQSPFEAIEPAWTGEAVHVTRPEGTIAVEKVSAADIVLLDALAGGATLPDAAAAMLTAFPDADLPATFTRLLNRGALMLADAFKENR
jgi:hypothetical protein